MPSLDMSQLQAARGVTFEALRNQNPQLAEQLAPVMQKAEGDRVVAALRLPDDLRARIGALDTSKGADDVVAQVRTRLDTLQLPQAQIDGLVQLAQQLAEQIKTTPVPGTDPGIGRQIELAHVRTIGGIAGLDDHTSAVLSNGAPSLGSLDGPALGAMVTAGTLTEAQAQSVVFAAHLYVLVDQDSKLAAAIRTTNFTALGNKPPGSIEDLAKLTNRDWATFFIANPMLLPTGRTAAPAAAAMSNRFAALYPGAALLARLPPVFAEQAAHQLDTVAPLFAHNKTVIGSDFSALDQTGINPGQADQLRAAHGALRQLANSYPGLQLASLLDNPTMSAVDIATTATKRVGYVHTAAGHIADTSIGELDFSDGGAGVTRLALGTLGATADEQRMVLQTFRAYQRLWLLSGSADDTQALAGSGFDSALSIARHHFSNFQAQSGLERDTARTVWSNARLSLADATLSAGSIMDMIGGMFGKLAVSNQPPVDDYLQKIPGFQDLFGNISFCHCEECQSILGPAAYFVDLMKYIDENLRTLFVGKPNHPLDLKFRRPDLWTLQLSCDNTNTRIATLDIVNEVLENHIAQRNGFAGDFADRTAVGTLVYQQTLTQRTDSFIQPFHLPLARIAAYLESLEAQHADIADAVDPSVRTIAELGLSQQQRQIIATPDADLAHLGRVYGIAFAGTPSAVADVDAAVLAPAMHLSRDDLGALVATKFVQGGGAVKIIAAKRDANSIQNDVERVTALTATALDRMHRFTRLVRHTGWSNVELDLVLGTIGAAVASALDPVADLHRLQRQFSLTVPELCALIGPVPQDPVGRSLFDRLFNPPSFVSSDGPFPKPAARFIHPAFRQATAAPVDPAQPRLLAGLGVDLDGLASLARHLAPHLGQEAAAGFNPTAPNDNDRYFVLSIPNLNLLYRHALLARLLKLSIDDLFEMLGLLGLDSVDRLVDLHAIVDFWFWWQRSGYRLDEVALAVGRSPRDITRFPDPATIAANVAAAVATALVFTDTVFAVALGTTEKASRELIDANATVFETTTDGKWRLKPGIDLTAIAIAIPASATVPIPPAGSRAVTDVEVRQALRPYLAGEALVRSLGSTLNLTTAKVTALAALAGVSLTSEPVVRAVRGDGRIAPLVALVAAMRPLAVALAPAVWDGPAIDFLRQNPALFGAGPLPQTTADMLHPNTPFVTLEQLRAIATYARVASRPTGPAPDAAAVDPVDIRAVLTGFQAGPPAVFPAATDAAMARALAVPSGLVVGLRGRVVLPAIAAAALDQLDRAARVAESIGIDGETLGGLVSNNYAFLSHAADALYAALGARFTDETTRAQRLELAEQPVREAKRDALGEYLIRSIDPRPWKTLDDLYQYFLIDIDSGGCATTSRLVAATMSAQLYIYRAIMQLERDALPTDDPMHVALRMPDDAAAEWDWRRNYRVWQANREVFLSPENYLDPDLRDDKTPLFTALEQGLLQTDISDQNVLDAYTAYLAGLEEVAMLRIAGAYQDIARSDAASSNDQTITRDVLHLFGATAADPPIYYYRTCENLLANRLDPNIAAVWSAWQKVTVQITGRRVAPVVFRGRLHVFWTDLVTRPLNKVENGASTFAGYQHTMTMKFTTLRPDGTWTVPQSVELPGVSRPDVESHFERGRGQIMDPLSPGSGFVRYDPYFPHTEARDDYTLVGLNWDGVWPVLWSNGITSGLDVEFRNFIESHQVDLFERRMSDHVHWTSAEPPYPQLLCAAKGAPPPSGTMPLFYGRPTLMAFPNPAYANLIIDERRMDVLLLDVPGYKPALIGGLYTAQIGTIPDTTDLLAIPGSPEDGMLQIGGDIFLLQGSGSSDGRYILTRLGTTLIQDIARRLFETGVDSVLDTATQYALAEAGLPITLVDNGIIDRSNTGKLDFIGPYGIYYRELFFHIPFLIANALNSRGRYAAAQRWYHHIFDPTASEIIDTSGVPPADIAHRLLDRVWRYREFRGLDIEHLQDVLTDPAAIALYKKDPFNPWAIARCRISALQKTIVIKYVSNLMDWADSLFSQFTTESVNEAMMLYIMASDIFGPRPVELGSCGLAAAPQTYEGIVPLLEASNEFLTELETIAIGRRAGQNAIAPVEPARFDVNWAAVSRAAATIPLAPPAAAVAGLNSAPPTVTAQSLFTGIGWNDQRTASWAPAGATARIKTRDAFGGRTFDSVIKGNFPQWAGRFGYDLTRQITPVFCVPANSTLLDIWSRIEGQLYKIRHCMDIDGNLRQLALFAPPIDPMQLVRMKAAGLSLEDVLGVDNGNLPPYRFLYLVDRAKALAASLSGFGVALLSAIEKRDAEEINRLRLTQSMNLAQLTTQVRQSEIKAASESLEAINRQLDAANYRSKFYDGLLSQDLSGWETAESDARYASSGIKGVEGLLGFSAAVFGFLPQVGSPFAMKYGGVELHSGWKTFADATGTLSAIADAVAVSTGLHGVFNRRAEGWRNQRTLADYDVKSLTRQANAASIRLDIANRALDLHQKSIDQIQEMLDLTDGKFSNYGLYVYLGTQLQRLYRGAYQNALALANLALQAYRFERGEDNSAGLLATYWDPTHAGLLAGESLLIDLHTLERRFLETNYRLLEIDQPFALSQIDPTALIALRQTGECTFTVPEVYFDLFYPGHYKRRIKAIRLTIPSITGPYVNMSAALTLTRSWVRPTAQPGAPLVEVPPSRSLSIATSTAQNDAGVFELSFRDERYMPFEGLGAISQWSLSLPKVFRQFDYQTMTDVIISISYTAEHDGVLRAQVEAQNAALEGSIVHFFSSTPARRLFSLRQEFSSAFTRLARGGLGTQVTIEIADRNFPLFLQGRNFQVQRALLLLRTAAGASPNGFTLTVDGAAVNVFSPDPTLGNLQSASLPGAFATNLRSLHTLAIQAAGSFAPTTPTPGDSSAIDVAKLEDLMLYVEFVLT